MRTAAQVFFAFSLVVLGFALAVVFSWWGLIVGVPLVAFAGAVMDRVLAP